ncbi:uncharacterized protein LY79DRAFT_670783 [Colletotrichum navitas]|uniref:Helicase C-terminal domain-containing protein n=1 Tax=Colletotrichum navitas TaxID=681940 RepID=A0AAD8PX27_9PEZI|nr:uncharacterized protein LY79DRAFT_670783 [Colletotrichum navitas]KAK1585765.1 hypothetical protein LY79DRAFT_670783 [Colletotrichum navitas]
MTEAASGCHTKAAADKASQEASRLAVVYCRGINIAKRLASEEATQLKTDHVMFTTSAFSTSLNYGQVSLVVHYSAPYDLINWNQMASWARRNGSPAVAVILYVARNTVLDRPLSQFLAAPCFRQFTDAYFDGATDQLTCLDRFDQAPWG